jgi:F-type H+-transporting ATPase subunit gamma
MDRMLGALATSLAGQSGAPALLAGNGKDQIHLLIAVTGDRGLCGGFNSSIARATRQLAQSLLAQGKIVKILPVGRKGRDQLKRDLAPHLLDAFEDIGKKGVAFSEADKIAQAVIGMFEEGAFDVCTVVYNRFQSVISQVVTRQTLIPLPVPANSAAGSTAPYEFEPSEEAILSDLLPRNLAIQLFRSLLESSASEQGARMTAMDNATRNAGDMLNKLTIKYNRSRQAQITKELIEIISGAEAL